MMQMRPGDICRSGKVCFDKRTAQTKANAFHRRGIAKVMRIYQCLDCNLFHLSNKDRCAYFDDDDQRHQR